MTNEQRALVAQVAEALDKLQAQFPGMGVEVWSEIKQAGVMEFTAGIGNSPSMTTYGVAKTPLEAVAIAARKYGDELKARARRIEQLRSELKELESKI